MGFPTGRPDQTVASGQNRPITVASIVLYKKCQAIPEKSLHL